MAKIIICVGKIRQASRRVWSLKLSFLPTVRCYLPFFQLSYFPTGLRTLLLGRARGRPGAPGTKKQYGCRIPWPFWHPFGDFGVNFAICLDLREGIQKLWFFGIAPKHHKSEDKSKLGGPCRHFVQKTWIARFPLASLFHCFCEWPNIKKSDCFSILFNGFGPSKTIDSPIDFSSNFHVCSKPLPGTVFRGYKCWTLIKSWIVLNFYKKLDLGAIFDFQHFQKGTFWTHFSLKRWPGAPSILCGHHPCRDPAFHETKVITVPFGPSVF